MTTQLTPAAILLLGACAGPGTTLVTDQFGASGIAVDADYMYWSNGEGGGAVQRVPKAGGATETVVEGAADSLAVDDASVYWTDSLYVYSQPKDGGKPKKLASDQGQPVAIAVDAANAYWVNNEGVPLGVVMEGPLDGSGAITLAGQQSDPSGLAIDATYVYWTAYGDGTVMRVPIAGGTPETLARDQKAPSAIAVDASAAYFLDGNGVLASVSLTGGDPKMLARHGFALTMTLSEGELFWNTQTGVWRTSTTGRATKQIAASSPSPQGPIAVDATNVYWADALDGTLRTAPR